MNGGPEDPVLIALGASLSDGAPIDWNAARHQSTDTARQRLFTDLREVAAIVSAQRQLDAREDTSGGGPDRSSDVRCWRHLVLFERVGAGAFGTVYRSWDTQVDREVAVKLLPQVRISPLEEARTLGLIRHPNVVTVHGADQEDGHIGIWMEYIEGRTLAEMVREHGPMSAREVSGIGLELCRALSALHHAGVVHRDIKAQNVMREVGGRIVLMDFSGAGHLEAQDESCLTGTPAYMAPELFGGAPASAASDIYSIGVLLFFLMSAQFPVAGGAIAELLKAHQSGERRRLRDLRADVPDAIVQVIERATSPDPAERYQTAGELEHALATVSGSQPVIVSDGDAGAPRERRARHRANAASWVVAATLLLGLAVAAIAVRPAPSGPPLVARFTIGPPYVSGSWPRISPNGRYVVFGAMVEGRNRFWIRALDSLEGHALTNTTATETPFWSPDSRALGFFSDGKLQRIAIAGGEPETLADAPHPHGGDWNRRDTLIFARDGGIYTVGADGSNYRQLTAFDHSRGEYQHAWPVFLPDGTTFLYVVSSSNPDVSGVYRGSLTGSEKMRVMRASSRVSYANGYLLFVRQGTLTAQAFDSRTGSLHGEPIALARDVKYHARGDAAFDVSPAGALIYRVAEGTGTTRLMLLDRRGRDLQAITPPGSFRQPRFSPDGSRVVAERTEDGGNSDLWVYDLVRRSAVRLTQSEAPDVKPVWSPDGRSIAFSSKRGAVFQVFIKTVDGTERERSLIVSDTDKFVESWSPDGKYLSGTLRESGLWIMPLSAGAKARRVRTNMRTENWQSEFSPDGRWLAYTSLESESPEVYVEPFPATGERWQLSTHGGAEPHWRLDAKELWYLDANGWLMAIDCSSADWQHAVPRPMFRVSVMELAGPSDFSISPDGERIVVNTFIGDPVVPPVQVVLNWTGLLSR